MSTVKLRMPGLAEQSAKFHHTPDGGVAIYVLGKAVDPRTLYQMVKKHGGYHQVCQQQHGWALLALSLGLLHSVPHHPRVVAQSLQATYEDTLLPFEQRLKSSDCSRLDTPATVSPDGAYACQQLASSQGLEAGQSFALSDLLRAAGAVDSFAGAEDRQYQQFLGQEWQQRVPLQEQDQQEAANLGEGGKPQHWQDFQQHAQPSYGVLLEEQAAAALPTAHHMMAVNAAESLVSETQQQVDWHALFAEQQQQQHYVDSHAACSLHMPSLSNSVPAEQPSLAAGKRLSTHTGGLPGAAAGRLSMDGYVDEDLRQILEELGGTAPAPGDPADVADLKSLNSTWVNGRQSIAGLLNFSSGPASCPAALPSTGGSATHQQQVIRQLEPGPEGDNVHQQLHPGPEENAQQPLFSRPGDEAAVAGRGSPWEDEQQQAEGAVWQYQQQMHARCPEDLAPVLLLSMPEAGQQPSAAGLQGQLLMRHVGSMPRHGRQQLRQHSAGAAWEEQQLQKQWSLDEGLLHQQQRQQAYLAGRSGAPPPLPALMRPIASHTQGVAQKPKAKKRRQQQLRAVAAGPGQRLRIVPYDEDGRGPRPPASEHSHAVHSFSDMISAMDAGRGPAPDLRAMPNEFRPSLLLSRSPSLHPVHAHATHSPARSMQTQFDMPELCQHHNSWMHGETVAPTTRDKTCAAASLTHVPVKQLRKSVDPCPGLEPLFPRASILGRPGSNLRSCFSHPVQDDPCSPLAAAHSPAFAHSNLRSHFSDPCHIQAPRNLPIDMSAHCSIPHAPSPLSRDHAAASRERSAKRRSVYVNGRGTDPGQAERTAAGVNPECQAGDQTGPAQMAASSISWGSSEAISSSRATAISLQQPRWNGIVSADAQPATCTPVTPCKCPLPSGEVDMVPATAAAAAPTPDGAVSDQIANSEGAAAMSGVNAVSEGRSCGSGSGGWKSPRVDGMASAGLTFELLRQQQEEQRRQLRELKAHQEQLLEIHRQQQLHLKLHLRGEAAPGSQQQEQQEQQGVDILASGS